LSACIVFGGQASKSYIAQRFGEFEHISVLPILDIYAHLSQCGCGVKLFGNRFRLAAPVVHRAGGGREHRHYRVAVALKSERTACWHAGFHWCWAGAGNASDRIRLDCHRFHSLSLNGAYFPAFNVADWPSRSRRLSSVGCLVRRTAKTFDASY